MEDLRTNKTELYIIIECVCEDGTDDINTFIFDNKKAARERFKNLVKNDKKFLAEEGRNDTIEERKILIALSPRADIQLLIIG